MASRSAVENQCSKPRGWLGRFSLWRMNASHSKLTDWGLEHVSIEERYTILDVGCGGGRTVGKLAAIATQGKVYGIDHSGESVAATKKMNAQWIKLGRVEARQDSVSQLQFPDGMFEVLRVLKPGGALILIAEVYKGANTTVSRLAEKYASRTGMNLLSVDEHRKLFIHAGYSEVQVIEERNKGWICDIGKKPIANP